MTTRSGISIWTIYDRPSDYPTSYVARKWVDAKPTDDVLTGSLESLRERMRELGLSAIQRHAGDDPKIIECWL